MKEEKIYDESEDTLIVKTSYDPQDTLDLNKAQRNARAEHGRYKQSNSGLIHVGRIEEGDIIRLKNMGYNLMSPDRDEWRRALLYIQTNEPYLLTMPGKPISKKRFIWS